ncbi:MAG: helix-turn-helix domain-containing protein [Bacteriovorax sp.]|nr:helix-turn-helix domain-containing protein [Bacteriovorax sp.]
MKENVSNDHIKRKKLGNLIECIRYTYGLNQTTLAMTLGVAQSSISKIEKGDLTLSAFQWCDLAQSLNLPIETIKNCYLDNRTVTVTNSYKMENGYEITPKYSENRCIKVRCLLPFISFMDLKINNAFFDNFLNELSKDTKSSKSTFLKRSFFCNLDNQVNLLFVETLIQKIKDSGASNHSIAEISYFFRLYDSHGLLAKSYEKEKNQINILKQFIQNFPKYNNVLVHQIMDHDKNSLIFSSTINDDLSESYLTTSDYCRNFIELLFEKVIKDISLINFQHSKINSPPPVSIKKHGGWNKKNGEMIFEITQPLFA